MTIKTRVVSILICLTLTVGLFSFCGCGNEEKVLKTDLSCVTLDVNSGGLSGKPWETDTSASYFQKEETDLTEDKFVQPAAGTLLRNIYMDDIDEKTRKAAANALEKLGVTVDTLAKGAHDEMKTHLDVANDSSGENVVLKITGYNKTNDSGTGNGYVILVPSAVFGAYSTAAFSYQYDLVYGECGSPASYIGVSTDYCGKNYSVFAVKASGIGINQVRIDNNFYDYDVKGDDYAPDTGETSIINEILGISYNKDVHALTGISISVRGVIDPENGNSYYVRVNDEGYPGSGKWTLVSRSSANSKGAKTAGSSELGYNVALITTDSPNGAIDNFMLWTGDGDEPKNKENAVYTGENMGQNSKCTAHRYVGDGTNCQNTPTCVFCGHKEVLPSHKFVEIEGGGDAICEDCHCYYRSLADRTWPMPDVPLFDEGGSVAIDTYNMGQVPSDTVYAEENESLVQLIEGATADMLKHYCKRLEGYGFERVFENSIGDNLYYQYVRGDKSIYAYYSMGQGGEIRLIIDKKDIVTPADISFEAKKGKVTGTEFYQFGMDENVRTEGMMYVIKLCDNSVIIIDGYHQSQIADERIDDFMDFLREITGTKDGEKIRIAAWISSHAHSDHFRGFANVVNKYDYLFELESVISNYPSIHCNASVFVSMASSMQMVSSFLEKISNENTKFIKAHDGQEFSLAGVKITVMFTPDDLVDTMSPVVTSFDFNSSSVVYKIEINGTTIMMLGDMTSESSGIMMENYYAEDLKADVVQTAHHLYNIMDGLYTTIHAKYVLVTTSENFVNSYGKHVLGNLNAAKKFTTDDKVFFEATATYGFSFKRYGKFKHFYTRPLLRVNT